MVIREETGYCFRCGVEQEYALLSETNQNCDSCGARNCVYTQETYLDIINDLYLKGMLDEYFNTNELKELELG